jgi:hypothetical protein
MTFDIKSVDISDMRKKSHLYNNVTFNAFEIMTVDIVSVDITPPHRFIIALTLAFKSVNRHGS